jgi:hypothetical protein
MFRALTFCPWPPSAVVPAIVPGRRNWLARCLPGVGA